MNEDFEDQLRLAIRSDDVEIAADTDTAIRDGRRIVRGRRLAWGVAACTVVAAAALLLPGLAQRGVPGVPVQPGATTSASPASGVLAGTEWNAVKLEGAALRPGTAITLRFGDGWVDGFGGCNDFGYTTADGKIAAGAYHQDGDRLSIAPVATTTKGCANGVSDQEGRFLQAIPRVDHFLISSGGLVLQLFGADGGLLVQFEPAAPKLERTGWTVTAIKGAPPVPGTRPPSLVFLKDSLYGYDGCNSVNGTLSSDGALTLTVGGGTLKLCPDAAMSTQVENFRSALEEVSRVMVQGDQLSLLGRAGTPLLQATSDPARVLAAERATWQLDNKGGDWGNDSGITLRVNDATLSGKTGCAEYTADFQHAGDTWTIAEPTLQNPHPCPNTVSARSERFLGMLQKVTAVQATEDQLRLITPDETLSFSRK
ncbi:MAG TPA: META domain-containing protein [Propionicimonas sp.]